MRTARRFYLLKFGNLYQYKYNIWPTERSPRAIFKVGTQNYSPRTERSTTTHTTAQHKHTLLRQSHQPTQPSSHLQRASTRAAGRTRARLPREGHSLLATQSTTARTALRTAARPPAPPGRARECARATEAAHRLRARRGWGGCCPRHPTTCAPRHAPPSTIVLPTRQSVMHASWRAQPSHRASTHIRPFTSTRSAPCAGSWCLHRRHTTHARCIRQTNTTPFDCHTRHMISPMRATHTS